MISTSNMYSTSLPVVNIPYTGSKIKELNQRQKYNKLYRKNDLTRKNLIDHKITPINQESKEK